jgi:radical SAM superfamily enzyme YgiQ (UPF0313 family)
MKVLFVNPPITTCLHVTETGKQYIEENIGNQFFPLSKTPFEVIHKLNNIKDIKKDIILLDFEWYKNPSLFKEDFIDLVINKEPNIILTTLGAQASIDTLDWLTTKLKEKQPNLIIIAGGQAISHLQEKIFNFCPNIDFALLGNADNTLPKLIKTLCSKKDDFNEINGLLYKRKEKIIKNKIAEENLITYSKEIYEPYKDFLKEIVKTVENREAKVLSSEEFSKGCPYQCNFCAAKRRYKEKNILKVVSTLNYLIEDLTFGVNLKHREEVLKELKKIKGDNEDFGFRCVTRADLIDKKFVKKLLEAGCYEVGIGIECNDGTIMNLMNKRISVDKNIRALEILGKSGISFKLFLIEGYKGSNSQTSKLTFGLLNYLEEKEYNYFIQPALNRDIISSQKRFIEKERQRILRRGTTNQLDFRHDCREHSWDTNRGIRSICLLMLAYPSTELGKKNKDKALQSKTILDIPFPNDIEIEELIKIVKKIPINSKNKKEIISLRIDLIHFIDGVYTIKEIKEKIRKLYSNLSEKEISEDLNLCIENLRESGLIDSFGNPNTKKADIQNSEISYSNPKRNKKMLLFWNGKDKRYIYDPLKKKVIKIKTCFYKNIPEEVFEFLILLKGAYSIEEIAEKLHKLLKEKEKFRNLEEAKETTKRIYQSCKEYGLCN